MKKLVALVLCCAALITSPVFAAQDVGTSMMQMSQSYRAMMKDKTLPDFKADLAHFKTAVLAAQEGVPTKLANKPADDPMRVSYREGIEKLLSKIKVAEEYVNEGNLTKPKKQRPIFVTL